MPVSNNPFRPTQPVYPGMFAGRLKEIDRIEKILIETRDGNPTDVLIIGERGIGKTSLLLMAKSIAKHGSMDGKVKLDFLTCFVPLDRHCGVADLARKISTNLERALSESQPAIQFLKNLWQFVHRIEISGSKIAQVGISGDAELFDNFSFSIIDTVKNLTDRDSATKILGLASPKDGLVIFLDEADNAPAELDLGTLIKQLSEKLVAEQCNNVLVVVAGLPQVRDVLKASHGSALRLFEEIELEPLSHQDIKYVIDRGLNIANKTNENQVKITDQALSEIVTFSEGYPHFVQQFGYCAYEVDDDDIIDSTDVNAAALKALDLIGDKYYKDMYYKRIKEDSYRQVLNIMAEKFNSWITKDEIRQSFRGKKTTLDNAINALIDRNIILRKTDAKGKYRLQWAGFALWIKLLADKQRKLL